MLTTRATGDEEHLLLNMMTSSNGTIFRVTGPLYGKFTGPGEFPAQRPVTRSFDVFCDLHPNNRLSKNGEAGDLRRHRVHHHVTVMMQRLELIPTCCTYLRNLICLPTFASVTGDKLFPKHYVDGLLQERRSSSALTMALCLSCTNLRCDIYSNVVFFQTLEWL